VVSCAVITAATAGLPALWHIDCFSIRDLNDQDRSNGREAMMNWDQIRGNWEQTKGELKVQWSKLTDDDVAKINGERDKLVGRLQELYGISKEEAEKQVDKMD
jgi:uncharacterized protein YjbJ (UPF0337 family)